MPFGRFLALGLIVLASPVGAQEVAVASAPQASPDTASAQNAAMQEQLQAAQREIAQLRAEIARQGDQTALLTQYREKNDRLVAIGNELIAAYGRRYRRGQFLPFESGRRKFEAELQAIGDRVYDNKVAAGPHPIQQPVAGATQPPQAER